MSSTLAVHCSSSDKLLDGVDVYKGWLENSGAVNRGEEGAEDGTDAGRRAS